MTKSESAIDLAISQLALEIRLRQNALSALHRLRSAPTAQIKRKRQAWRTGAIAATQETSL